MEPVTKEVIIISLHFMILFTAFNAFQNIVTSVNESQGDKTLGPFRFALNYTAFLIANFFAPGCKFSEKWQIVFATLTYVLHYLTGFFVANTVTPLKFAMAAIGAIINGIGGSFLWTSLGRYIHKVCILHQKETLRGHYVGIFNTIFCFSTILGAIIVTFGLSAFTPQVYFGIVSGVAMMAFFYGLIFIKNIKLPNQEAQNEADKISFLMKAKNSAVSTLKYYPIMKYTLGLIALNGLNLGIVISTMLHLLPTFDSKSTKNLNAGFCLLAYGFGCVAGGFLGGKLTDYLKIRKSSLFLLAWFTVAGLFSIGADFIKQMWSAVIACTMWGFSLYYITALEMVICSRLYKGAPESFALVKQFHSVVFVVYQIIAITTGNSIPVFYLMIGILVLGFPPALWGMLKCPQEKVEVVEPEKDKANEEVKETVNDVKATTDEELPDSTKELPDSTKEITNKGSEKNL